MKPYVWVIEEKLGRRYVPFSVHVSLKRAQIEAELLQRSFGEVRVRIRRYDPA